MIFGPTIPSTRPLHRCALQRPVTSNVGLTKRMERSPSRNTGSFKYFIWHSARCFSTIFVSLVLPLAHALWGERYSGDGQQEFGELMTLGTFGMLAALIYLGVGTVGHFVVRRKGTRALAITEASILGSFLIVLAVAGITAHHL